MSDAEILSLLASEDADSIREGAHMAGKARLENAVSLLARHASSSNIGVQEAADRALRKIGGAAVVNAVIPMLRSDDAPARNTAMDILRALGSADLEALFSLLKDDDVDVRIFAADILGSVGTPLAVPPLSRALLHDPEVNVRYQAAISLGSLGFQDAAPDLNKALGDEEWVQFAVIEALTTLKAESSVAAMVAALEKSSDLVASTIVDALGEMGNIKAVALLMKKLDSSPTPLCNKIVKAVINILGSKSLTLLGTKDCERLRGYLQTAVEDEDTDVQDASVRGFAALGGEDATRAILKLAYSLDPEKQAERLAFMVDSLARVGCNPALETALRKETDSPAQPALSAFLLCGKEAVVPLLMEIFPNCGRDVRRKLILELAERAGKEHQAFFLNLLTPYEDGNVLRGALMYLGSKGEAEEVQERILPLLSHTYDDVKSAAVEACIALGTPFLKEYFRGLVKHHDPVQRMMAVYALGFFSAGGLAFEEEKDAVTDESSDVRRIAVESLSRSCPVDQKAQELIEERMNDENREVRMAVVEGLAHCSPERLSRCLTRGLDDPDPWVRVRCAERLGENRITESVERLVGMLSEDNHLIVIKAVEALGMIGGETAFRALLPLLEHSEPDLQAAAEEALERVRRQAGE